MNDEIIRDAIRDNLKDFIGQLSKINHKKNKD